MKEITSLFLFTTLFTLPQDVYSLGFGKGIYVVGNVIAATEAIVIIGSLIFMTLTYVGWQKYKGQKELKERKRDFE